MIMIIIMITIIITLMIVITVITITIMKMMIKIILIIAVVVIIINSPFQPGGFPIGSTIDSVTLKLSIMMKELKKSHFLIMMY